MSVFFAKRRDRPAEGEKRSVFPSMPFQSFLSQFGTGSYADVDLSRAEASLQKVAVWAAVDLICSVSSELPIDVYRGEGSDKVKLRTPPHLLDPGADGQGVEDWISQALISWLLRGNVIGTVMDERQGVPLAIELKHPDRVSVFMEGQRPVFSDERGEIPADRLFHKRVYPIPGQLLGMSPIQHHTTTIGLGIAVTRFGKQWFSDGAHPGGILSNSEVDANDFTREQKLSIKSNFINALRGTREPVVLGKGWKYDAVQVAPEESQMLETAGYSSAECARIFGPGIPQLLGYETGGSLTYSTAESRNRDFLVYAFNKWLRRIDRLLSALLPVGQYVRLNRDALLQSTTLERWRVHEIALRNRARTVNEVRAIEDEPPVLWGDEPNPIAGAAPIPSEEDEPEGDDEGQDDAPDGGTRETAQEVAIRVNAAGTLIRSGFEAKSSLGAVGLPEIDYLPVRPVTVQPIADAQGGAPAPDEQDNPDDSEDGGNEE